MCKLRHLTVGFILKGNVVRLDETRTTYPMLDWMQEVVLIEGKVKGSQKDRKLERFSGPKSIPFGITSVIVISI